MFGCRDTILKKAPQGKNYRSQGGKSIHFWKALITSFTETSGNIHGRSSESGTLRFYPGYFLKDKRYQNSVTGIKFYTIDKPTD